MLLRKTLVVVVLLILSVEIGIFAARKVQSHRAELAMQQKSGDELVEGVFATLMKRGENEQAQAAWDVLKRAFYGADADSARSDELLEDFFRFMIEKKDEDPKARTAINTWAVWLRSLQKG